MRKLRPNNEESLDLLLDTLCDVFSSIILIACLLALLTNQQTTVPGGTNIISGMQGRVLTEKLDAAKSELAGLQKLNLQMKDLGHDPLQTLMSERNELQATQERLRKLQATQMKPDTAPAKDPTGDIKELRSEVKALDQRVADAKARKDAAEKKAGDLAAQIQDIRSKITAENEKHSEHVRFPKERAITKAAMNIILQNGAIYPLVNADGENFSGLTRVTKDDESFEAIPKKSAGMSLSNVAAVRRLLASYKRWGGYVSLNVFPDSFETFRAFKVLILAAGLDYGFDVYPEHYIITFSPKGSSPAPL